MTEGGQGTTGEGTAGDREGTVGDREGTAGDREGTARVGALIRLGIGILPLLWLLGPGLRSGEQVPGIAGGGVYVRLYELAGAVEGLAPVGFPNADPAVSTYVVPLYARLLSPLTALLGAATVWEGWLLLGGLLGAAAVWRATGSEGWVRAGCVALAAATPAAVAAVAGGEPGAMWGWAAVLPWLAPQWSVPLGVLAGLADPAAPGAAALVGAWGVAEALIAGDRAGAKGAAQRAGWAVGALLAGATPGWWLSGLPDFPAPEATWFGRVEQAAIDVSVTTIHVGFLPVIAAVVAVAAGGEARRRAGGAILLFAAAALGLWHPARLLGAVPILALRAVEPVLRARGASTAAAAAVLLGAGMVGEGWKGSTAAVPLELAPIAIPDPVRAIRVGPVLDLPAGGGPSRVALWHQIQHQQAVAATPAGQVDGAVWQAEAALQSGAACPDLSALGFRTVVLRREHAFRSPEAALRCLGTPNADDGRVMVWELPPPPAPMGDL